MIIVSAFSWVPDFAKGLVRDLRVRWALEEVGLPYQVRLLNQGDQNSEEYRKLQPFGQVPIFQEGDLTLFESGAIVLHIGERSETLLPKDPNERARAVAWLIAALNSVEIAVMNLAIIDLFYADQDWAKQRRPGAEDFTRARLTGLAAALGDRDYLEGRFTAGDLMMAHVLANLRQTDILADYPTLKAYKERCEARPAYQRALNAQLSAFKDAA